MTNSEFSTYFDENKPALLNFANKLTNYSSKAPDLVQETALKAFKASHTFKKGTSFKSWTFTILKNTFISEYRKTKRRSVVSKPVEELAFALDQTQHQKNGALEQMNASAIQNQIEQLSYKCRMPFLLYTEGYQYNEIAETLNVPIGTVKSRINYARKKLQDRLTKMGLQTVAA